MIETIDTKLYDQDFSIIVNLETFGQIQCDLSTLLALEEDEDVFPWAVKQDDLEIFLLTMVAQKKRLRTLSIFFISGNPSWQIDLF